MAKTSGKWASAVLALAATAACGGGADSGAGDPQLAALPIDPQAVTVGGVSAGGYMAVQMHVAHSGVFQGAAVLAGGPYLCAEGSLRHGLGRCMAGEEEIPTARLIEETSRLALAGAIDPIAGLADDRVWIFRGADDTFVGAPVAAALETYYQALVDPAQVARLEHSGTGHIFPTANPANPACTAMEPPFVGNCGLDGARALLAQLYGEMTEGSAPRPDGLVSFDQRPYAAAAGSRGLADSGWLYVPEACAGGGEAQCRLHVFFHGCKQGASYVGDEFVKRSGFLEVAEANRIVLLFPQVEPSYQPLNPNGCWDWWGYEGEDYATRNSPQIKAVRAMVGDLLGGMR